MQKRQAAGFVEGFRTGRNSVKDCCPNSSVSETLRKIQTPIFDIIHGKTSWTHSAHYKHVVSQCSHRSRRSKKFTLSPVATLANVIDKQQSFVVLLLNRVLTTIPTQRLHCERCEVSLLDNPDLLL